MFVEDVAALLRLYMDESDQTFVTPANVAEQLRMGYDDFRRFAHQIDPRVFVATANLTLTNVDSYDLSLAANPVRLLGPSPTQAPMVRMLELWSIDPASGLPRVQWVGVRSYSELAPIPVGWMALGVGGSRLNYCLEDSVLRFGRTLTDTLQVRYVPYPSRPRFAAGIDWTRQTVGNNEFIDNLDSFHPLVACYAYRHYAIRNWKNNTQLQEQTAALEQQFRQYLMMGRNLDSAATVAVVV